ncbi:MAG: ATP-binding protein, partial [Gemmatimonadetes bacterium]|nr:ATP-binding protein [Gemmatimonadota bacterium]
MTTDKGHDFKVTGVLRASFEYQDLVAVDMLIDFLRDRHLYDWVKVEAEDTAFRSIDDVVTCKDGQFELTQVKFTPDPASRQHSLNWEWLTKHKPKGTSLLQKWSKTTSRHIRDGSLSRALLKTDRRPDDEFKKCLLGNNVVYDRLSSATKQIVDGQIGSRAAAIEFFECFEFVHSQERLETLEEDLRARLSYETDNKGWAYFRECVRRWGIRKNRPQPDGRIRHHHLVQIFAPERPTPLPQDFIVPHSYRVPDETFHQDFLEKIATSDGVSVLWGPPGRGKSTYLSHCVEQLRKRKDLVCIRHHYFLRISDRTEGRFSYFAIVASLKRQLTDARLPAGDADAGLSDALAVAASELTRKGHRLVVIVDGLDHVWREAQDLTQMEELFGGLLPLPEGVRLVVGTQKVEDQYLPKRLLTSLPKGQWTELPAMSTQAVCDWLMSQWDAGRLPIEQVGHRTAGELIEELASALHRISAGLPLHLVYSVEALLRVGGPIMPESVDKLPVCPSGEIEDYYQSLWVQLSSGSRRVLHLLAGLQFGPPSYGLGSCLSGEDDWWTALEEVDHLLQHREASVVPFHASLFAFLRGQEEHAEVFGTLVQNVTTWLERDAPKYWRDAWLWVTQAQQGDATRLMEGPSREWAINWLASGYPVDQMIHILNLAEYAALDAQDFPRLIRLRTIKDKVVSAREYQSSEWGSFLEAALSFSREAELGAVLRDSIPELRTEELIGVVVSGPSELRQRMLEELNRRNAAPSASDDGRNWDVYADSVVRIVAREESEQAERVIAFAERTEAIGLIETYACESMRVGNFENVFAVGSRRAEYGLDRHVFAALCIEGLGPGAKTKLLAADRSAFQCLALLKGERSTCVVAEEDVSGLFSVEEESGLVFSLRESAY